MHQRSRAASERIGSRTTTPGLPNTGAGGSERDPAVLPEILGIASLALVAAGLILRTRRARPASLILRARRSRPAAKR